MDTLSTPQDRLQRCDRCGAVAKFQVLISGNLDLMLCRHHVKQHATAMDDRYPIVPTAARR